jgi:hypothetical protein
MHKIQNARIKPHFNANRATLHTNGRTVERETCDELQVTDHRSSGSSGHEEDWHACLMIGKAHPIEEQRPKL